MKQSRQGGFDIPPENWRLGPEWEPRRVFRSGLVVVPIALVLLFLIGWVAFGGPAYTIGPDEEGVVLTFGRFSQTAQPGLHFKWPWPFQHVEKVRVSEVKRIEIGFRSQDAQLRGSTQRAFLEEEARMLTGDENVVDASMVLQYRVKDVLAYLFNFEQEGPASVEGTLHDLGEATLRQAVGDHPIDDVLTVGKTEIQSEILDSMQRLADQYAMGVTITSVQLQDVQPPQRVAAAFLEVATAREEREQKINEAQAYRNTKLPEAEGQAARVLQRAQGYMQARIAEAEGSVQRFLAIAEQYDEAPEVTRTRLFLDSMEELLPKARLKVIDSSTGVVNLNQLGVTPAPVTPKAPQPAEVER